MKKKKKIYLSFVAKENTSNLIDFFIKKKYFLTVYTSTTKPVEFKDITFILRVYQNSELL